MFAIHNIQFSVRSIRYWEERNIVDPKGHLLKPNVYQKYFKKYSNNVDVLIVIEHLRKYRAAGVAWVNTICTSKSIAIVDIGHVFHFNPTALAQFIAHEVGHVLGLTHVDGESNCSCSTVKAEYCIMYSNVENNCPKICDHFVCGIIPSEKVSFGLKFERGNLHCIIPAFSKRTDLLVSAPTFMLCDLDQNGNESYCYEKVCKKGENEPNCENGLC
ncbi:hypothetical protein HZS_4135, partial [Henneguya salminicola]